MHKKISYFFLSLYILSILVPIYPVDNVIGSDSQSWENEYGKLTVYPATSNQLIRQKQYATVEWYYPDNTLTVAFGFDNPLTYGKIYRINNNNLNPINMDTVNYNGRTFYTSPDFNVAQNGIYNFYWEYDTPLGSNGKWDMYAKLASDSWSTAFSTGRYIHLDPWWNSSYKYNTVIRIESDFIETSLTNIPILVNISADISSKCDNGNSLRFVDDDNATELSFEFESGTWNPASNNLVWVKLPYIDVSTDTYFNIFYNNSNAEKGDNSEDVWSNDYVCVLHFNDTSGDIQDSTSNDNDFYLLHGLTGEGTGTGIAGKCADFEKDSYDSLRNDDMGTYNAYTIEIWPKLESLVNFEQIYQSYYSTGTVLYADGHSYTEGEITTSVGQFATNIWYYLAETCDGTNKNFYLNSTKIATKSWIKDWADWTLIGIDAGSSYWYDGLIDEFRVSSVARNNSWVNATYHSIMRTADFLNYESEIELSVIAPTVFVAATETTDSINLTWVTGVNSTYTYIERNTVSSWGKGGGTLIYNNTGTSFLDAGLSGVTKYYYQAWAYNQTLNIFGNYNTSNNITSPGNPTVTNGIFYQPNSFNITWTNHSYSDTTLVVRKLSSYPTGVTDGTILYNGTLLYYNDTSSSTSSYYKLFSWNETVHQFSSGVNVQFGSITINVYDENTSLPINSWGIVASNADGSQVYVNYTCSNPTVIDTNNLPTGTVTFFINSTLYNSRIYTQTIIPNIHYTLDAYLPLLNITQLCRIDVVGPQTEYGANPPIERAYVKLSEFDNSSGTFKPVSTFYTDANGQYFISLTTSRQYLVNITKSGYNTELSTFIVQPDVFIYTFRLSLIDITGIGTQTDLFSKNISFICLIVDAGYLQLGNITINYVDVNSSTIDTDIYIYESYNGTNTLIGSYHNASNSFNIVCSSINTSRNHYVILFFNNTATFIDIDSPMTVYLPLLHVYLGEHPGGKIDIDTRIVNIIGPSPFVINGNDLGWHAILAVIPGLIVLMLLGPYHAGIAIVLSGVVIGATSIFFEYMFLNAFPLALATICPLIVAIGIIYIWIKPGSETLL